MVTITIATVVVVLGPQFFVDLGVHRFHSRGVYGGRSAVSIQGSENCVVGMPKVANL